METFFNTLEYYFALEFLVDFGNFWIAKCAEVGGEWVNNECVSTNLDDKLNTWVNSLR